MSTAALPTFSFADALAEMVRLLRGLFAAVDPSVREASQKGQDPSEALSPEWQQALKDAHSWQESTRRQLAQLEDRFRSQWANDAIWLRAATMALGATDEERADVLALFEESRRAGRYMDALGEELSQREDEFSALFHVRPLIADVKRIGWWAQRHADLSCALYCAYDGLPPDVVERAHRLRWQAARTKVAATQPETDDPLMQALDAMMEGQTAREIVGLERMAASERAHYEAFLAAGGDPQQYDPSLA